MSEKKEIKSGDVVELISGGPDMTVIKVTDTISGDKNVHCDGSVPKVTYVRKYWLFGPLVPKKEYPYLFQLNMDIENEYYTRGDVEKAFEREVKKLNRKKDIENGNIL